MRGFVRGGVVAGAGRETKAGQAVRQASGGLIGLGVRIMCGGFDGNVEGPPWICWVEWALCGFFVDGTGLGCCVDTMTWYRDLGVS